MQIIQAKQEDRVEYKVVCSTGRPLALALFVILHTVCWPLLGTLHSALALDVKAVGAHQTFHSPN